MCSYFVLIGSRVNPVVYRHLAGAASTARFLVMCNRATRFSDWSDIKVQLQFPDHAPIPNLAPSWTIRPTNEMLVAVRGALTGDRLPAVMHWGIIPPWSKDGKVKGATWNTRAEEIDTKPTWRGPWEARHRCLIITNGFYEWQWLDPKGKKKQPYGIARADGKLTVMAGIWEGWRSKDGSEKIRSCSVITTEANPMMAEIHNTKKRMPVILEPADWPIWLNEIDADLADAKALLRPATDDVLIGWKVGQEIGAAEKDKFDKPSLFEPVAALV
jgi:putative SOS response-associated peptidase YedK